MNPKLTPRQTKVIAVMDEMLSYAKQAGSDIRMIGLTRGQFLDFMTIARKKRKHPQPLRATEGTKCRWRVVRGRRGAGGRSSQPIAPFSHCGRVASGAVERQARPQGGRGVPQRMRRHNECAVTKGARATGKSRRAY